jgi:hypothetical protein
METLRVTKSPNYLQHSSVFKRDVDLHNGRVSI